MNKTTQTTVTTTTTSSNTKKPVVKTTTSSNTKKPVVKTTSSSKTIKNESEVAKKIKKTPVRPACKNPNIPEEKEIAAVIISEIRDMIKTGSGSVHQDNNVFTVETSKGTVVFTKSQPESKKHASYTFKLFKDGECNINFDSSFYLKMIRVFGLNTKPQT